VFVQRSLSPSNSGAPCPCDSPKAILAGPSTGPAKSPISGSFSPENDLALGQCLPSIPEYPTNLDPIEPESRKSALEDDLEIDPESDPIVVQTPLAISKWEKAVCLIVPRQPVQEDPDMLRLQVANLMDRMKDPNLRTDPASSAEAEALLANLPNLLRDLEHFVARTFSTHHAAWEALLGNSKRKSAKAVLGWLRHGVKPQFVGTQDAKESKRKLVVGMLKRQVPASSIPFMFSGNKPHPVVFDNHKSFYDK
jgi:hypothetical protein